MVGQEILVLFIMVRIRALQPRNLPVLDRFLFGLEIFFRFDIRDAGLLKNNKIDFLKLLIFLMFWS